MIGSHTYRAGSAICRRSFHQDLGPGREEDARKMGWAQNAYSYTKELGFLLNLCDLVQENLFYKDA